MDMEQVHKDWDMDWFSTVQLECLHQQVIAPYTEAANRQTSEKTQKWQRYSNWDVTIPDYKHICVLQTFRSFSGAYGFICKKLLILFSLRNV